MNTASREWWLTWGLVSLLTTIGCSTEKAEMKSAFADATPAPITNPFEQKVIEEDRATEAKNQSYFVTNENIQPVYFELSKSKLNDSAQETLKKNAEWLKKNPPVLVQIAGYSDTRGSQKRNQTLAERRASQVRDFYVTEGIPQERLMVVSVGAEDPSCPPVTEDCLAKSRRVETLIESKPLVFR